MLYCSTYVHYDIGINKQNHLFYSSIPHTFAKKSAVQKNGFEGVKYPLVWYLAEKPVKNVIQYF